MYNLEPLIVLVVGAAVSFAVYGFFKAMRKRIEGFVDKNFVAIAIIITLIIGAGLVLRKYHQAILTNWPWIIAIFIAILLLAGVGYFLIPRRSEDRD